MLYQHSGGWGLPLALMAGLMVPQIVGGHAGRAGPHGRGRGGPLSRRRRPRPGRGVRTGRMPVLEPNPQNGQKKMLLVFGAFLAIFVVIGVIATIASALTRPVDPGR